MNMDSAKLIGGGRPFKKRGVGRPTSSAGSETNKRKRREAKSDYDAPRDSNADVSSKLRNIDFPT